MGRTKAEVIEISKRYAALVDRVFDRVEVRLFGSYHKGTARPDSDIDLAVISNDFEGINYITSLQILNRLKLEVDLHIEPVSLTYADIESPLLGSIGSYIAKESEVVAKFS